MITVSKVSDVEYYVKRVGEGRENYYLDAVTAGEPPGQWYGKLAAEIGLEGEVAPDDMRKLFGEFETPDGTKLGRAPGRYGSVEERLAAWMADHPDALPEEVDEARRRIERTTRTATLGVDLTASVPKSVSVVHTAVWRDELKADEAGDEATAERFRAARLAIERAIHTANRAALEYLEERTVARAGRHGGTGTAGRWVKADGLAVASFFQHTSRSIDPQLHIHNVVLNRVRCEDGQIRAIDTADLFAQQGAFSAVFDRVLAEELAKLGLEIVQRHPEGREQPSWEVKCVSQRVADLFSSRRQAVTGRLAELVTEMEQKLGRQLTRREYQRLRKATVLTTRGRKLAEGESWEEMLDRWQAELSAEVGSGLAPISAAVMHAMENAATRLPAEWSPEAVKAAAVAAVSRERAAWQRDDLMREIERQLPILGGNLSARDYAELLDRLTDQALADPRLVTQVAGRDDLMVPAELGGSEAYNRPSGRWYASTDSIAAEEALRKAAITRGRHHLTAEQVDQWLDQHDRYRTIGEDQRAAVRGLATSDAAVATLWGPAGTGKSFAVGALAEMWGELSGGGRVHGLATGQIAADVLARDGVQVVANTTVWLDAQKRLRKGGTAVRPTDYQYRVRPNDIVLIDEASMVDREVVSQIHAHVEAAGARLVLTGDPAQLSSIGAGGVLGLLDGHAETYTLSEVRRFSAEWEGPASLRLRDRDASVLTEYERHGRLVECEDLDAAMRQAARAAAADLLADRSSIVVAGTNEQAAQIAGHVRDQLVAAGVVEETGVELEVHGGVAGVGDTIMCRQNDRRLGVTNRELYRVTEVGEDGSLTVAGTLTGEILRLPRSYVREHVASGYAGTVHAVEGVTVDSAHWVTDGATDARAAYVGMTRGRHMNRAYVALQRPQSDPSTAQAAHLLRDGRAVVVEATNDTERPSARAVLEDVLERSTEDDDAALVRLERDVERLRSADTLLGRLEDAVRVACRARLERQLDQLQAEGVLSEVDRARLAEDQATEHLSRLLRGLEQAGHDPEAVLREAVSDPRGFDDANSVAQVLSARIQSAVRREDGTPAAGMQPQTARVPEGLSPTVSTYLHRLHERIADRERELGTQVAVEQPAWALRALGPVPQDPVERLEWERRAGVVAAHREATGWTDDIRPIGDAPGVTSTERRASWWRAWEALGMPEDTADEAAMSEGRLRLRVQAWEREKAWAPPTVDEAMAVASGKAIDARVEAILQDDPDLAAQADEQEALARMLERVAQTRDAWAAETAVTRENARRAMEELERRGIDVGAEPDRTTAEEWLAAQRAADEAEDPYREIGEDDILDEEREQVLTEGVSERSGDLSAPTPEWMREDWATAPQRELDTSAAFDTLDPDPDMVQVELATARAADAADVLADRQSLGEAADPLYVEPYTEQVRGRVVEADVVAIDEQRR